METIVEETKVRNWIQPHVSVLALALSLTESDDIEAAMSTLETELERYLRHLDLREANRIDRRRSVREAALNGRLILAPHKRGRPAGSANFATKQLHLSLAAIWAQFTGKQPTRRYANEPVGAEYGPFQDFEQLVFHMLPSAVRPTRAGRVPTSARTGVDEAKQAEDESEEYRQRGLIAEADWLAS